MSSPPFPSRIGFGSFLVYPSPAHTEEAKKAKNVILALKQDRFTTLKPPVTIIQAIVQALATRIAAPLREILTPDALLVPLPKSAPLVRDAVWPSRSICEALVSVSLGREWRPLIARTAACKKAAFCTPANRPTPRQHYDTMAAIPTTLIPTSIVLVDDVVTKGATIAGAAARLLELYPDVDIRAFAIARTSSEFTVIEDACTGDIVIDVDGQSVHRRDDR